MLSRIEVTDPPKAAPTEIEASISKADSGSIENVNGIRIAMATGPPRPGNTPTKSPITVPRMMKENCFNCSAAPKPKRRLSIIAPAGLTGPQPVNEPVAHDAVRKAHANQIGKEQSQGRHGHDAHEQHAFAIRIAHQGRHQHHGGN